MKSKDVLKYRLWLLLILASGVSSCDIINPEETSPTILRVQPFDFEIQPGQGSGNNRITEVWVYADGDFLGAFLPPVDIYYLEEGPRDFVFRPGIRNNGIAGDAIVYPMFTGDTIELVATPGEIFDIQPVTAYRTPTVFSLLADFEVDNPFTDNRDTVAASELIRSEEEAFEGQYSGKITMSEQAHFIEVGHALPMSGLPTDGKSIYLEFRYKCEVPFSIGLLGINLAGQSFSNFFYLVVPTEDWNMLYIDLTEFVSLSDLPAYKILFRSLYPDGSTEDTYDIFLDNIKVVHL